MYCGILILENNKTYGVVNGQVNKSNKHYYRCIPNNSELSDLLIPFEYKQIGFSKIFKNHYITFKIIQSTNKHPIGQIIQNIGPVDILEHFYEYQLYCKNIFHSIQPFTKNTLKMITPNIEYDIQSLFKFEERTCTIFSIDPFNSKDFDDAFSIQETALGEYILSIYISNVSIWLDYLQLWQYFSNRVSTIYLPDKKHSMLPTILSDNLCSLKENELRFAFTMDIFISGDIREIKFSNTAIKLKKNYVYEEQKLLALPDYTLLKNISQKLNKLPNTHYISEITDSHHVVEYLMIFMNHICSQKLLAKNLGIFRNTTLLTTSQTTSQITSLHTEQKEQYQGQYVTGLSDNLTHNSLGLSSYIHITSPIRRLVDLLNILEFQKEYLTNSLSQEASLFYDNWYSKLDYINSSMKSIKKVQNDCNLLYLCTTNPSILEQSFEGFVIEEDKLKNKLMIYLPKLKLFGKITAANINESTRYKLYIFNNESKMKKKIRLQYI
jgi:exoribonuclease R